MKSKPWLDYFYMIFGGLSILLLCFTYHLEGTALENSLNNSTVRLVFAISLGLGVPLLLQVLLEALSSSASKNQFARSMIALAIIIPPTIYLAFKGNTNIATIFAVTSITQRIFGY
jgi:hypothetical protein